ncbi:MAG: carboxymuconolactone decarboxylase family protein [Pseudomonadales bacterium]
MSRFNIQQLQPDAYAAMFALEKYLATSLILPVTQELVRIRASQINGCHFCIGMHSNSALKQGETEQRLSELATWKESSLFSERERAILAVTEEVTLITDQGLSEETYQYVKKFISTAEIAQLIMLISTINAWNRMAISMRA